MKTPTTQILVSKYTILHWKESKLPEKWPIPELAAGKKIYPKHLALYVSSQNDEYTGASLNEPALVKSGILILKDYNSWNKIGIRESTLVMGGRKQARKVGRKIWWEKKALPYRRKLTNNGE